MKYYLIRFNEYTTSDFLAIAKYSKNKKQYIISFNDIANIDEKLLNFPYNHDDYCVNPKDVKLAIPIKKRAIETKDYPEVII